MVNSFFYEKLTAPGYTYSKVKSWTQKESLLDTDKILVPINKGRCHWVLGCINLRDNRFEFYDSKNVSQDDNGVFVNLRKWLKEEWQQKKKKQALDLGDWVDYTAPRCPQQKGNRDCGLFVLKFSDALLRDLDLNNQPDWRPNMALFRKWVALSILSAHSSCPLVT